MKNASQCQIECISIDQHKLTSKLITSFYDSPIARNISLTTPRIVRLSPTQRTRDAIHGESRGLLILELLQQLWILGGVEERNDGAVFEFAEFFVGGWTKLCVVVQLLYLLASDHD